MTWLWTGTTFEMGDERKKIRDETPAGRSHQTQEEKGSRDRI